MLFIINRNKTTETNKINYYDIKENMLKIFKDSGIMNEKNID